MHDPVFSLSMRCPACSGGMTVVDSRPINGRIRRRRVCAQVDGLRTHRPEIAVRIGTLRILRRTNGHAQETV
jgi:transcriptional regulator NrdR family protein